MKNPDYTFTIENGKVSLIYNTGKSTDVSTKACPPSNGVKRKGPLSNGVKRRAKRPYFAQPDASIQVIINEIEKTFGLPIGSVNICDQTGKKMSADAKISSLRENWVPWYTNWQKT